MNNTGGLDSAISAWDSTIEDLTISGNTIRGFTEDGIYLNDVKGPVTTTTCMDPATPTLASTPTAATVISWTT